MSSSKSSKRPRPRSLARYIAASASRSIVAGWVGLRATAMPIEADVNTSPDATWIAGVKTSAMRSAISKASASSTTSHEHDELVAAQARHGVRRAHRVVQARADLDEQLVARLMAERVVDRLELVDVEQQHGDGRLEALGAREGLLDAVEEQRAVRQARQRVVQRLVAHHRLRALAVQRGGEQVGDGLQPLALLAGEGADAGVVHGEDPEGAAAPADRGGGAGADAGGGERGRLEAPLAGPLPDDERLLVVEDAQRQALLVLAEVLVLQADARDGAHAPAVGQQLEDRAVLHVERLGEHPRRLVEQERAVAGEQGQAPEAGHRRLAPRALALRRGPARLGFGTVALGGQAVVVGAPELAGQLLEDAAHHDDRRGGQQHFSGVVAQVRAARRGRGG